MWEEKVREENDGFCGRDGSDRQRESDGLRVFLKGNGRG